MNNYVPAVQAIYTGLLDALQHTPGIELPKTQSIQTGLNAWDCTEFALCVMGTYQGEPGRRLPGYLAQTAGVAIHSLDLIAVMNREAVVIRSNGQAPTAAAKTASALQVLADGVALENAWWQIKDSVLDHCINVYCGGVDYYTASGGMTGCQLNLSIQI